MKANINESKEAEAAKNMFSFNDYKEIIKTIQSTGQSSNYWEALKREKFIISRHDVEYSVERAHALAKAEESMNFRANYFIQWTNNSYNILSKRNMDMIKDMNEQGHTIGLHYALNGLTGIDAIKHQIVMEIDLLSEMFGFEIRQFSIHRPTREVLRANIRIPGLLNAYQDEFFTYSEDAAEAELSVKYMSDANHIWRYGYPDEKNLTGFDKVQILTHPFAWTPEGYDNFDNYKALIREKYQELIESVDNECKDFGEYRDYFVGKCIV